MLGARRSKLELNAVHRYVARLSAKTAAADKWSRDFAPPTEHRQRPKKHRPALGFWLM
jgi:hypothetical protein